MKRISRSLSNFTSPGSVESFSSGVTTEKRSTCMPSNSTHKARLWLPSVYKVKLRVMRGLLRLLFFFCCSFTAQLRDSMTKIMALRKKVCHGAKFTLLVGGGFWQIAHTSYSRQQISRHPELPISQQHFHLPSKDIIFFPNLPASKNLP